MKKFLCMLLASLMLCGTAMADAYQGHLYWEADVDGALAYLAQSSEEEGMQLKSLAEGIAELANGLDIRFNLQDEGVYGALSLKDTLLLDMTVFGDAAQAAILTNLLPGHYLNVFVSQEDAEASLAAIEQLEKTDWAAVVTEGLTAFDAWCAGLPKTEEYGSFMGDAYEGGVYRESYTFDDKAVADLVDSLLTVLDKHGINDGLLDDYLGSSGLLSSFAGWNGQIAQENRYDYTLHQVYGMDDALVCISLVVQEAGEQVMTFSLATAHNGWRGVWGYGLNGLNYYVCAELLDGAEQGGKSFTFMIYQDPEKVGFRAVEPYVEYVLMMVDGTFAMQEDEQETRWQAEVEVIDPVAVIRDMYYVLDGTYQHESGSVKQTLAWYLPSGDTRAEQPMLTGVFTMEACEPQAWSTDGLTAIQADATGEEAQLMESLIEESTMELIVNLFKLMPTQLSTLLMM